jgi:hypothetical protein
MAEFTDGGRLNVAAIAADIEGVGSGRWPPEPVETDVPFFELQQRDAAQRLYNIRAMEIARAYDENDDQKLAEMSSETVAAFLKRMGAT